MAGPQAQTAQLESMTSTELEQLLNEQTSAIVPEVEAEATEETQVVEEQSTEETPPQEETTEETMVPETGMKSVKLKVEGKEVEIPEEKMLEYAQKGYHYEKKMADLKSQREELDRLKSQPAQPTLLQQAQQFTPEQIKEELIKRLNDDPGGTLFAMMEARLQADKEQTRQERIAELEFDLNKNEAAPDVWKAIKPKYDTFRAMGESRETAFLKAENDYFKSLYVNAKTVGMKEGQNKEKLKMAARIPGAERASQAKGSGKMPSDAEIRKMTSAELLKYLPMQESPD